MSKKKRTSLEAIFDDAVKDAKPPTSPAASPPTKPAAAVAATRVEEAAARIADDPAIKKQTAYLKVPIYEQLRRLAFDERHKMHDYLIEGLDRVFRDRGLPSVAELEKESA
jgi:hypothetical protein